MIRFKIERRPESTKKWNGPSSRKQWEMAWSSCQMLWKLPSSIGVSQVGMPTS